VGSTQPPERQLLADAAVSRKNLLDLLFVLEAPQSLVAKLPWGTPSAAQTARGTSTPWQQKHMQPGEWPQPLLAIDRRHGDQ